ncbi:MAG: DNA-processing protein DprA [Polyangia bacterium]
MTQTVQQKRDLFANPAPPAACAFDEVVVRPDLPRRLQRLEIRGNAALVRRLGRHLGVAIVGARAASRAGLDWARALAEAVAREQEIVVSGGALGIDGAAHEGAVAAGAPTVVVLGTGVDVVYPLRHGPLFAEILASRGALVSPFPAGTAALPGRFPTRNPLIAALSRAVVVVEASARSGSLGTGQAALTQGTHLYCRPGSAGCDLLLARGARPASSLESLVAALFGRSAPPAPVVDAAQARVLAQLGSAPLSIEELTLATGLALDDLLCLVLDLEASRSLIRLPDGRCLAIRSLADTKE